MSNFDDLYNTINNNKKLLNQTEDRYRLYNIQKNNQEIGSHLIKQNKEVYNTMRNKFNSQNINEKARIAEINNQEFRKKQLLVNRLTYIIFFILYLILLGIFVSLQVISKQTLVISFIIGVVYLIFSLFSSTKFLKLYGDVSMEVAKGATREFIQLVGDIKTCPKECILHKHKKQGIDKDGNPTDIESDIVNYVNIRLYNKDLPHEIKNLFLEEVIVENDSQ